jgi:hypothetical protein
MSLVIAMVCGYEYRDTLYERGEKIFTTEFVDKRLPVEIARDNYNRVHDLKTMLAYGRAMDTAMVNMDLERAALEKRFYHQLAKDAGDSSGIPWNILYAIWMRESSMNPRIQGDAKYDPDGRLIAGSFRAFGLGQIHLATARSEVDLNITKEQLLDPIVNGHTSAQILRNYTDKFHGNLRYGISAYQQGPASTQSQYARKLLPANIAYVLDVYQYAAEVHD